MTADEIRKLLENVTEGPWDSTHIYDGEETITQRSNEETPHFLGTMRYETDANFIAAARLLLPKLLAVAEAAKKVADRNPTYPPLVAALAALEMP